MKMHGERHIVSNINEEPSSEYVWLLDYIREYKDNNKVIVDIACGTASGSYYVSKEIKQKIIGVDYDSESLKYSKELYTDQVFCPIFATMDCHSLAFKNKSIDIIISSGTIKHLVDINLFLNETKRVLKKKGLFIIVTPNKCFSSPNQQIPVNLFHIKEYTYKELGNILREYYQYFDIYGVKLDGDIQKTIDSYRKGFRYKLAIWAGQLEVFRKIFRLVPVRLQHKFAGVPLNLRGENINITRDNLDSSAQFYIVIKNL